MTKKQIELCVQLVPEKEFNDQLSSLQLRRQPPQARFVFVVRNSKSQLVTKFFRQLLSKSKGCLVIDRLV